MKNTRSMLIAGPFKSISKNSKNSSTKIKYPEEFGKKTKVHRSVLKRGDHFQCSGLTQNLGYRADYTCKHTRYNHLLSTCHGR